MTPVSARRLWPGLLAAVAAVALLTAACSGSSSPGGSGGSPAAGKSASPSAGSGRSPAPAGSGGPSVVGRRISPRRQLAFSECMRSHGVPGVPTSFPGPVSGTPPSTGNFKPVQGNGPNPGSPQWNAAQQACRSLAPSPVKVPG
jgi:hypothetical protein